MSHLVNGVFVIWKRGTRKVKNVYRVIFAFARVLEFRRFSCAGVYFVRSGVVAGGGAVIFAVFVLLESRRQRFLSSAAWRR